MAVLMESSCLSFRDIPHTSTLFADYLYDFPRVADFFAQDPFDRTRWAVPAPLEQARRMAVADVLAEQNGASGADPRTQENIARLREGKALAVVTGQQVGLFGGPAYSVYKALTAICLAEALTAEGRPAVPVFWLASEDHDFAEVSQVEFLDARGTPLAIKDESSTPEDAPVGRVVLPNSVDESRRRVLRLWPGEVRGEAEQLLQGYVPGQSYAAAFAELFRRLFAGQGLIMLNPLHPTLHALTRPLYRRVLEEAEGLDALLRSRNRALEQHGYHAQVRLRENSTLVFLTVAGKRLPIRRRHQGFFLSGMGVRSLAGLLEMLEAEPEQFSANVLLRSLVQDSLLPTVAYVAGPAETAYFAQASALYEHLLGWMPPIVPRVSLTLIEPRVQRLLTKYHLTLADCFQGRTHVRTRLAVRHLPPRLQRRLERMEARLDRMLVETAADLKALDPTLEGAAQTSRRKMLYQFDKLRGKAARAHAARKEILERHLETLCNALYPHHHLQERRYSFLSFVARHGTELVPRLKQHVSLPCRDHQVIFL